MALIEPLKTLFILFLFLPKSAILYEFFSIGDEQMFFIRDICKFYGSKSAIFLYDESISEMEVTTIMFKWRRAFSWEGTVTGNLYFSQLYKSSYYFKQIIRPYYIAVISNYNAINEFSLATSTFDMSSAVWIVVFIYKEHGPDYCHNPPGNIFHLRFNSEMLVRCGTENILREWYSIDTNQIEMMNVATWSLKKGITKMVPNFLYERRHNLQGLIMKAVIVKTSIFSSINKDGELDGIFGRILRELCVTLNFSFDIVSQVKAYGRWNSREKTWSGAIAELYYGRADISLSDFSMTNDRLNAVDFTIPLMTSKNILVIREPENLAVQWSSHFLIFTFSVWIALFGVLIASSIFLVLLKIKSGSDNKIGYLLIDNLLEIWGIFCQQRLPDFSPKSSLRIVYFSLCLSIIVFWAAYSAALISFLTSVNHVFPFDSLEGFAADGTYQLAVVHGTAYYDKFANSGDPLAKEVMKLMLEEEKLPRTETEGFKRICKNGRLAMYTYDEIRKRVNYKILCKLIRIDAGHVNNFALILSKNNPFTDVINFQLRKFMDKGMMSRLKDISFKRKSNNMIQHQPVSLISVISLIFFLSIGIILSTCILIIEKYIFIYKRKKISTVHNISSIKWSEFSIKRKKNLRNITKHYVNHECARLNYSK
uniref:glutamate receptor-like isoform X1 n=1 Tax=Vespula vulgaris TaxID=7454 RepID=UPI00223B32CF|nr:glutamate receptor-like isoform X1 [Vespula vulgaris]